MIGCLQGKPNFNPAKVLYLGGFIKSSALQ